MKSTDRSALLTSLMLLFTAAHHAAAVTPAEDIFQIQPIARLGDTLGGLTLSPDFGYFGVGALNDSGHLTFTTGTNDGELLIQYANGELTPIVLPGGEGPGGKWPLSVRIMTSVKINQQGNAVFAAGVFQGEQPQFDVFRWDFQTRHITLLAQQGTPAPRGHIFESAGVVPELNDSDEIAFVAKVKGADGKARDGVFFLGQSGLPLSIALPDDELPDGSRVAEACCPSINNAGRVAFRARKQSDAAVEWSAYLWENGAIAPLVKVGMDVPGLGQVSNVWSVWLNDQNQSALLEATVSGRRGIGLYSVTESQLTPIAIPGQRMPDGATLDAVLGISYGNQAGRHAFVAALENGTTAVYVIGADGGLSLALKSGTVTSLGTITEVGWGTIGASDGVALNSRGQIAVTVGIEGGADTLVLISPTAP
jgi:hypothetical protein